jgi:hypothetical protein
VQPANVDVAEEFSPMGDVNMSHRQAIVSQRHREMDGIKEESDED